MDIDRIMLVSEGSLYDRLLTEINVKISACFSTKSYCREICTKGEYIILR